MSGGVGDGCVCLKRVCVGASGDGGGREELRGRSSGQQWGNRDQVTKEDVLASNSTAAVQPLHLHWWMGWADLPFSAQLARPWSPLPVTPVGLNPDPLSLPLHLEQTNAQHGIQGSLSTVFLRALPLRFGFPVPCSPIADTNRATGPSEYHCGRSHPVSRLNVACVLLVEVDYCPY